MASNKVTHTINSFDNKCALTVTVKLTRRFRLRLWVAIRLIRLACFVASIGYEQEEESESEQGTSIPE